MKRRRGTEKLKLVRQNGVHKTILAAAAAILSITDSNNNNNKIRSSLFWPGRAQEKRTSFNIQLIYCCIFILLSFLLADTDLIQIVSCSFVLLLLLLSWSICFNCYWFLIYYIRAAHCLPHKSQVNYCQHWSCVCAPILYSMMCNHKLCILKSKKERNIKGNYMQRPNGRWSTDRLHFINTKLKCQRALFQFCVHKTKTKNTGWSPSFSPPYPIPLHSHPFQTWIMTLNFLLFPFVARAHTIVSLFLFNSCVVIIQWISCRIRDGRLDAGR